MTTNNVPVISRRTTTTVDFAVTSAYGGAGAAFAYTDPSRSVKLFNLASDDDIWYQVDSGSWTQLLQAHTARFDIDFSAQTLTFKLGENTDGSVAMQAYIVGVPSGLYADEEDVSGLPDDAVGALVNDGVGGLSWATVPDSTVSGNAGEIPVFGAANALTGDAGLTYDSGVLIIPGGVSVGTMPFTFSQAGDSLLLGDPRLAYDPTTSSLLIATGAADSSRKPTKWQDSQGNTWAQVLAQGVDFANGVEIDLFDINDANNSIALKHNSSVNADPISQLYIQRSLSLNTILMCSDDFSGSGKKGALVDVFAPLDADPDVQMGCSMFVDGVNATLELGADLNDQSHDYFNVTNGAVVQTRSTLMSETTAPGSPPPDGRGYLYMKDAGGGKTGLYVMFPDGSEQQIKVEP